MRETRRSRAKPCEVRPITPERETTATQTAARKTTPSEAAHRDGSRPTSLRPERGERGLGVHTDMLTAIHGDASQRWELACEEDLPLAVEITLATDPDENVRSAFLMGTRSRTVVLLMEQRETDPEMLEQLAQQGYASPERKLPVPLADLVLRELDGLYELLGLDDDAVALVKSRWARAQERGERTTVGDALREIGVIA